MSCISRCIWQSTCTECHLWNDESFERRLVITRRPQILLRGSYTAVNMVTQAVIPLSERSLLKWCHGVTSGSVFDCVATHPCWHVSHPGGSSGLPHSHRVTKTLKWPLFSHALRPYYEIRMTSPSANITHTNMFLPIIVKYKTVCMESYTHCKCPSYPTHPPHMYRLINTPRSI